MKLPDQPLHRPDPIRAAKVIATLDQYFAKVLADQQFDGPKHARLTDVLVEAIDQGVVREGDKLPSEAELTTMSALSLGTVQKALRTLRELGLIERTPGVGTIVRKRDQTMNQPLHCRFSGPDGVFLPVYPRLFNRKPVKEKGPWTTVLGDASKIVRLDRHIGIGERFTVVTHFYVDANRFPLFASRPFSNLHTENFKNLLREETSVNVSRLDQKLSFATASAAVATHIEVKPGSQILRISVSAYDTGETPVYYQQIFVPPNDLDLTIESRITGA